MLLTWNKLLPVHIWMSQMDVSAVTNMRLLFNNNKVFNVDISNWDVSNVRNMRGLFKEAEALI